MNKYTFFWGGLLLLFSCFSIAEETTSTNAPGDTWNWMPKWRDPADCGPNALYVLMKLEGRNVTLEEVKKLVPLDPEKGCSMDALIRASEQLGFPVEARFVKPGELSKLPRPFIFHGITSQEKKLGHFVVAVDFDAKKKNYALIDPIRETYGWNPEGSVFYGYSGYVLVPKHPVSRMWNTAAGVALILCGACVGCIAYRRKNNRHGTVRI